MRRLFEMNRELELDPPADWFVAGYFKYQPPLRVSRALQTSDEAPGEGLPIYEP